MTENEFIIKLQAMLDQAKSKKQINSDIKALQQTVSKLRLTATLLKGESKSSINQIIRQMEGQLSKIKLQAKFDQKNLKADVDKALQNISFKDINLNVNENKMKVKLQKVIADAKKTVQSNPISLNIDLKKDKLNNQLTTYVSKNSKIRESEGLLKQIDSLRNKIAGINDRDSLRNVTQEFQLFKSECAATGFQTKSTTDKIKGMLGSVIKFGSILGVTSMAVSNFQKSLKTIRENDTILVEINKTSNMAKSQIEEIGNQSYDIASKFGRISSSYLTGVQEMARAGYEETSKELAELSLLAQSAGDMTADTANNYLLATDKAYKYGGSVQALNAVLDGQNYISNNNAVALNDIAEGMSKAGAVASSYRVSIEDLSAMIGTIEAVTKSGGSEVGNGIKSILINLQNVTSDKIVDTLDAANASMTEMVNGTKKLREPISIIRDLAKTFNQLDEDDPLRAEILTNIGGKYLANKLSALLQNMDMFDKMLVDYSNGSGSAMLEVQKTAESLEGTLNRLQNSWDELVNTIVNKDTFKGGIGFLDGVIQSAEKIIDTFNLIPVALGSITGVMTAKNKDYGITKVFDKDSRKLDLEGNIFGIDFTQMKHFREASGAIEKWNAYVKEGKIDINDFNLEVVKNNFQLREYLSTCTDGSASIKGYKSALQAAGVATNSLRLGTILLNSALSFGLGLAIQGVITLIDYFVHRAEEAKQKSLELADKAAEESRKISELLGKYNQLTEEVKTNTGAKDELLSTQKELLDSLGIEQSEIDKLIKKYGSLSEAINQATIDKLKDKRTDLLSGYNAKKDDVIEAGEDYEHWYSPQNRNLVEAGGKDAVKAFKVIEKAGLVKKGTYGTGGGALVLTGDDKTIEGTLENYQKLVDAEKALNEAFSGEELSSNPLFLAINERKNEMKEAVESYKSSIKEVNDNEANIQILEELKGKELPGTKEEFETFKQKMIESAQSSKQFIGSQEDIKDSIINVLSTMPEFTKFFDTVSQKEREAQKSVKETSKLTFSEGWASLENTSDDELKNTREDLLKLAEAGQLTEKTFHDTKGADTFLDSINKTLPETLRLINKLVDNSAQLSSMRTGITTITSAYDEKKEAKDKRVGANTLDSMYSTLNVSAWDDKALKVWERYKTAASDAKTPLSEFKKVQDQLATSFVNSNNFLSNLNNTNQTYYDNLLTEMGITNAHAITTEVLNTKVAALALSKKVATDAGKNFYDMTLSEVVAQDSYKTASNDARIALLNLYLQQNILSNSTLNMSQKIQSLKDFIRQIDEARFKIIDLHGTQIFNNTMRAELAKTNGTNIGEASKKAQKKKADFLEREAKKIVKYKTEQQKVNTTSGNNSDATNKKSGKSDSKGTKAKPQKQEIDWMDRKVTVLNNKLSETQKLYDAIAASMKKADSSSLVKKENANLNKQIKTLKKLRTTYTVQAAKYQAQANKYAKKNLSKDLRKKVKNGSI